MKVNVNQMSLFGDLDLMELTTPVPAAVSVKTVVAEVIEQQTVIVAPKRELFAMTPSMLDGLTGPKAKARVNVKAIKLAAQRELTAQEKAEIAAYSGWGGLSAVFDENSNEFLAERTELKSLIGDEGYKSARESVLTAYYTEPHVIKNMWKMLEIMGFEGGNVLEPSCGSGNFIGCMPEELRLASNITAVEIDGVSAKLAGKLYADKQTKVLNVGIESARLSSESFDLVVGNIPFGNYRVSDKKFDHFKLKIHDYFFAKALDVVKPGGLVAFITSTGTMDKPNGKFRNYLSEKADLVQIVRLPSGAFSRLGGTDVTTDIVVLRKKPKVADGKTGLEFVGLTNISPYSTKYKTTHKLEDYLRDINVNESLAGLENVLGLFTKVKSQFGLRVSVEADEGWEAKLEAICSNAKNSGWFAADVKQSVKNEIDFVAGIKSSFASGFLLDDAGDLQFMSRDGVESQGHLPVGSRNRITAMVRIRDCAAELLEIESLGQDGKNIRAELNRRYDDFVRDHGYLMRPINRRLISKDSHAPLLWSLERYDEENDAAVKADLFNRPTVSMAKLSDKAESASDAIALSYNKFGKINIEFMAQAMDVSIDDLTKNLLDLGRIYLDPQSMEYIDAESYLSGSVRAKLEIAKKAMINDDRFEVNAKALEPIVPATIALSQVALKLGVPWIGADYVGDFLAEVMEIKTKTDTSKGIYKEVTITHMPTLGAWNVDCPSYYESMTKFSETWGTKKCPLNKLLHSMLNQKTIDITMEIETEDGKTKRVVDKEATIAARDKAETVQNEFVKWVFKSPERVAALEDVYNNTYNGTVNRQYDGAHLVTPGLSQIVNLRKAQKDSIWRGLVSGNTLFALAVGGGKTLIQICLAQESKRLGIANKPVLVVPNHMLEAFAGEYKRAYPLARILAASKQDFEGDKRRELMMRIATENWDAVIITHSSFGRIAMDQKFIDAFAEDVGSQIANAVLAADSRNAVRDAERQKKMIEAKLKSLGGGNKDEGVLTFDKLGVDMMLVDEADLFKNLWFYTKKTRVAGLTNTCSSRAFDMYLKSRLVAEKRGHDGFGLVFSTATPISNSIAEMFIMQTYLQPQKLKDMDIENFDAWSANFAREVTAIEVAPDGASFRMHTRFAQFVNVPELMMLFREVAEIRTKAMLNLPDPELAGGSHKVVAVPASEAQKAFVETLVQRAEAIRQGSVKPDEDNMLCVTGDGRKAALDMRIIDASFPDDPGSKVNACLAKIIEHWEAGRENRLTQLVFSDLSTPKKFGFSVYQHIKDKLIEHGVPESEIAFAQDFDTDKRKGELHSKVRVGKIRVLIGSTELMGFGTNVQDRLIAEHHLDAPWRPRDVEQRDGRIIRQGNKNKEVYIYRYVTSSTFDAYLWQTLERKAGFIAQVMEGKSEARTVEDVTSQALSFAEVKALASGNPMVIEKAGVDAQVSKLLTLKSSWMDGQRSLKSRMSGMSRDIQRYQSWIVNAQKDLEDCGDIGTIQWMGRTQKSSAEVCKELMAFMSQTKARAINAIQWRGVNYKLFKFGNFDVEVTYSGMRDGVVSEYTAIGKTGEEFLLRMPYGAEAMDTFFRNNQFAEALQDSITRTSCKVIEMQKECEATKSRIGSSFDYEADLEKALARQEEINAALDVNESVVETLDAGTE